MKLKFAITLFVLLALVTSIWGQSSSPVPTGSPAPQCTPCTWIFEGYIYNCLGQPIPGAYFSVGSAHDYYTDSEGFARITLQGLIPSCDGPSGDLFIYAEAPEYIEQSRFISVKCGIYSTSFYLDSAVPGGCNFPAPTPTTPPTPPLCSPPPGLLLGTVTDEAGVPLEGVVLDSGTYSTITGNDGSYYLSTGAYSCIDPQPKEIVLEVSKSGYLSQTIPLVVDAGITELDVTLIADFITPTPSCPPCTVIYKGTILDTSGLPIPGAYLELLNGDIFPTQADGSYTAEATGIDFDCTGLAGDTYIFAKAPGYKTASLFVGVNCGTQTHFFTLYADVSPVEAGLVRAVLDSSQPVVGIPFSVSLKLNSGTQTVASYRLDYIMILTSFPWIIQIIPVRLKPGVMGFLLL